MTVKDFEWFADRLEPAEVKSDAPGKRDWMTRCPVHGGSDSLHLEERNGKALVHCFGCSAKYNEIVEALEDEEAQETPEDASSSPAPGAVESESERTPGALEGPTSVPTVRRRKSHERTVMTPDEPDPIQWYADYCGVPRAWLEANIPVVADGGWLAHWWETADVTKQRKAGGAERRWVPKGASQPRLWPTVPDSLPEEVWLCEGETDVIVLRYNGVEHAYTAGSASQPLTAAEMKGLKTRGVERIVIAYDNDKEGHKAASETLSAAKECGLGASTAVLGDPLLGGPKDWREAYLSGAVAGIPETDAVLAAQEVWMLRDVTAAPPLQLRFGWLHPDDHTILFGDGGTGKGVIAAWWAARMVCERADERVLIVDYEEHARHEWRPRIDRFIQGCVGPEYPAHGDAPLERIFIYQPTQPIWDESVAIHAMIKELGITYVIVDSVTYACLGQEVEKSVTATQYSDAIRVLKTPVLSLAHTTKADADPKHPFGSVFWSNGARITVGVVTTGDFDSPRKLELKKANQGGDSRPKEIDWSWVGQNGPVPTTLKETVAADPSMTGRIVAAITNGAHTVAAIEAALRADGGKPPGGSTVPNTLQRMKGKKVQLDPSGEWHILTPSGIVPSVSRVKKGGAP